MTSCQPRQPVEPPFSRLELLQSGSIHAQKTPNAVISRIDSFDVWFRPKRFESERFYKRLGALVIKRYVPTGGDLVMRRLRRNHPERNWVTSGLQSLRRYEQKTRLNESIHFVSFLGFTSLAVSKFASGSFSNLGLILALALNLSFGLWPVLLQRYNRVRLYRAIDRLSGLSGRRRRHQAEAAKSSKTSTNVKLEPREREQDHYGGETIRSEQEER